MDLIFKRCKNIVTNEWLKITVQRFTKPESPPPLIRDILFIRYCVPSEIVPSI